jgi:hypothetical protein
MTPLQALAELVAAVDSFLAQYYTPYSANNDVRIKLEAARAVLAHGEMWKPIETAPKDGQSVLGFTAGKKQLIVFWFFNGAWHCDASYHSRMAQPTHWMLLPAAPKEPT